MIICENWPERSLHEEETTIGHNHNTSSNWIQWKRMLKQTPARLAYQLRIIFLCGSFEMGNAHSKRLATTIRIQQSACVYLGNKSNAKWTLNCKQSREENKKRLASTDQLWLLIAHSECCFSLVLLVVRLLRCDVLCCVQRVFDGVCEKKKTTTTTMKLNKYTQFHSVHWANKPIPTIGFNEINSLLLCCVHNSLEQTAHQQMQFEKVSICSHKRCIIIYLLFALPAMAEWNQTKEAGKKRMN